MSLDAVTRLLERATPGPWDFEKRAMRQVNVDGETREYEAWLLTAPNERASAFFALEGKDDLAFIAASRVLLPAAHKLAEAVQAYDAARDKDPQRWTDEERAVDVALAGYVRVCEALVGLPDA